MTQALYNFANLIVVIIAVGTVFAFVWVICRRVDTHQQRKQIEETSEDLDTPRRTTRQRHVDGG